MRTPGLDPGLRARQYLALAEIRSWQADDDGAAEAYAKALALARDPGIGASGSRPANSGWQGETLGYLDRTKEGERAIREALRIDRSRGAPGQIDVARDLEALGKVLTGAKEYSRARAVYNEALTIRLRRQGGTHPLAFQDLNQLGYVAYLQADNEAAERYFRKVLPLAEQVLGKKHVEYAHRVKQCREDGDRTARLSPSSSQTSRGGCDTGGGPGPATEELVFPLLNLGVALRGTGQERAAEAPLQRARAIATATKHPFLGLTLVELADVRCDLGDRASALQLLQQARPLMANSSGSEPWQIAWLDLVTEQCRKAPVDAKTRMTILQRWKPNTHFGRRAAGS